MFDHTGIPSEEMVKSVFPSKERIAKGPVAVIECYKEIPCNPCATSCKVGAIRSFEDINDRPDLHHDECIGCHLCVTACPGLAIMMVDGRRDKGFVTMTIPYEFRPLPDPEQQVMGLDRSGRELGLMKVLKVQNKPYQDKTPMISLLVPEDKMYAFRNIKVVME